MQKCALALTISYLVRERNLVSRSTPHFARVTPTFNVGDPRIDKKDRVGQCSQYVFVVIFKGFPSVSIIYSKGIRRFDLFKGKFV
jgi:hypothetical protein